MELSNSQLQKSRAETKQLTDAQRIKLEQYRNSTASQFVLAAKREEQQIQDEDESTSWPLTTWFILFVEFCERFCYYGLRSILYLYIQKYLGGGKETAKQWYHVYGMACYVTPLAGSVLADVYLGRYKVIRNLSFVYIIGTVLLTISAMPTWFMEASGKDRVIHNNLAKGGLALIAIGAGGIKPCVAAFGADQFGQYQANAKTQYFKWFYMVINVGALISAWLTPKLKTYDCFPSVGKYDENVVNLFQDQNGQPNEKMCIAFDSCHISAYALSAALMTIAFSLFILPPFLVWKYTKAQKYHLVEKFSYKMQPLSEENILIVTVKCIVSAVKNKLTCKKSRNANQSELETDSAYQKRKSEEGWLMNSDTLSAHTRRCTYRIMAIIKLFVPIIIFWYIFEQIGTIWVAQVDQMDLWTWVPILGYKNILADQIEVLNSIYVIVLIPLMNLLMPTIDKLVYRLDEEKLKRKPLHFMFLGLLFTGISSICTWKLQVVINEDLSFNDLPTKFRQFRVTSEDPVILKSVNESMTHHGRVSSARAAPIYYSVNSGMEDEEQNYDIYELTENVDLEIYSITPEGGRDYSNSRWNITTYDKNSTVMTSIYHIYNDQSTGEYKYISISGEHSDQQTAGMVNVYIPNYKTDENFKMMPSSLLELDKFHFEDWKKKCPSCHDNRLYFKYNEEARDSATNKKIPEDQQKQTFENLKQARENLFKQFPTLQYTNGARYVLETIPNDKKEVSVTDASGNTTTAESDVPAPATTYKLINVVKGRSLPVEWTLLQYLITTFAEVLISTTGLEFTYTQSPPSMKTICTAAFYTTIAAAHGGVAVFSHFPLNFVEILVWNIVFSFAAAAVFFFIALKFPIMDTGEIEWLNRPDPTVDDHEALQLLEKGGLNTQAGQGEDVIAIKFKE